jgi:hypothetical protein
MLHELERKFGTEVDLDADYYWNIWADAAFDMGSDPVPDVGQLSDDVDTLRELVSDADERPVIVWHDLAHVLGILQRVVGLDLPDAGSA